jgi:hypothetical protein
MATAAIVASALGIAVGAFWLDVLRVRMRP